MLPPNRSAVNEMVARAARKMQISRILQFPASRGRAHRAAVLSRLRLTSVLETYTYLHAVSADLESRSEWIGMNPDPVPSCSTVIGRIEYMRTCGTRASSSRRVVFKSQSLRDLHKISLSLSFLTLIRFLRSTCLTDDEGTTVSVKNMHYPPICGKLRIVNINFF